VIFGGVVILNFEVVFIKKMFIFERKLAHALSQCCAHAQGFQKSYDRAHAN